MLLSKRNCLEVIDSMKKDDRVGVDLGEKTISIADQYGRSLVVRVADGQRVLVKMMWQKDLVELIRGSEDAKVVRV